MKNKIGYNRPLKKRRLHKIKKHFSIFQRRLSFRKQKEEMERFDNFLLDSTLKSILAVKQAKYKDHDQQVFSEIDLYRAGLLNNTSEISYKIFNSDETRQINDICKIAASPKKWGQFLYFIAKYSKAQKVLEIGTNVGISGSYLLNGIKQQSDEFKFITMEGLSQLCVHCENHFKTIVNENNFEIISGLYDMTFPELIKREKKIDMLFIDGNHQKEPTLKYFEELKNAISDKAIFIFDDIYYNTEMTEAWNIIIEDDCVNFSIDMYKLGVIIIDKSDATRNKSFEVHLTYE